MLGDYTAFYKIFDNNEVYGITLRSESDEYDDEVKSYIEEIRGYIVYIINNELYIR